MRRSPHFLRRLLWVRHSPHSALLQAMHVQMSRECAGVPAVGDDELSEHGGSWQLGKAAVARRIESVEQRQLKLFISSPFKDMQRERDLILKIVMPNVNDS